MTKELPFEYDHTWSLRGAVARQVALEDEKTWAELPEERQLVPDTTVYTKKPPLYAIISFARSAMP